MFDLFNAKRLDAIPCLDDGHLASLCDYMAESSCHEGGMERTRSTKGFLPLDLWGN
jgi:hypothetical protein